MPRISLIIFICLNLLLKSVSAQNYFEQLPFPDSTNIQEMAFNSQGHIFVSTNSSFQNQAHGVYRSLNHGQTWELVLQVDPAISAGICVDTEGNIYSLVNGGLDETLFKSSDNGLTWSGIYVPVSIYWSNMEIFIKGTDTLFVSQMAGSPLRLLRSFDDGVNWDTVFCKPVTGTEYIKDLAIGDDGEVFMATSSYTVGEGALYKSTDYGTTWNLFSVEGNMNYDLCYNTVGDLFFTMMAGVYERGLYAVFNNEETITPIKTGPNLICVATNSSDDIFAGSFGGGAVYHTSDNGNTFNWITSGLNYYVPIINIYVDPEQYVYASSDASHLWKSVESTTTSTLNIFNDPISAFPNPTKDNINIKVPYTNEYFRYEILNSLGIAVMNGELLSTNDSIIVDVSELTSGTYLLRINDNTALTTLFIKF